MAQWSVAKKTRVLVVCSGNSAPSQITEALIRHEAGNVFEIVSAGIHSVHVRVQAVAVMREIGVDISSQRSKPLTDLEGQKFDFVITVCNMAREECPTFSCEPKRLHWPFEDPATFTEKKTRLNAFRILRDKIHTRVMVFLGEGGMVARRAALLCGVDPTVVPSGATWIIEAAVEHPGRARDFRGCVGENFA